jgi:hypothetical protein
MPLYRKKPIEIEAFQLTEETRHSNQDWPQWMHEAWQLKPHTYGAIFPAKLPNSDGKDGLVIVTIEGEMRVSIGDYIIQGVYGELYPCKKEIFEKTYEKA